MNVTASESYGLILEVLSVLHSFGLMFLGRVVEFGFGVQTSSRVCVLCAMLDISAVEMIGSLGLNQHRWNYPQRKLYLSLCIHIPDEGLLQMYNL